MKGTRHLDRLTRYFEETTDVLENIDPQWVLRNYGNMTIFIDVYTGNIVFYDMERSP